MSTTSRLGYHHVEHVMGMAVSVDVRDELDDAVDLRPGLDAVVEWLHHVDATFSTYLLDSPISRLGRGETTLDDVSDEVIDVLVLCDQLADRTDGAFDAFNVPAPNGSTLDPSGVVKGWSVEHAARILEAHGLGNFLVNAGGDIAVRGRPRPGAPWTVGIRHPDHADRFGTILCVEGPLAIATSATYERGAHIIDPRNGEATTDVASVTVVGPDLTYADAYATAVFVMGVEGLEWLTDIPGYEGFVATHDDRAFSTAGFGALRAEPGR